MNPIGLYVHVKQCMTFLCVLSKSKQLVWKNWEQSFNYFPNINDTITFTSSRLSNCIVKTCIDNACPGIIRNLLTLWNVRAGQSVLDHFNQDPIGFLIVQFVN